ncbi:Gastrula zinc finger protein XlCGF49.1-like [Oopsacas minuta]|uniref:Gastrula zinc finger protein XlCGF49.1-like n=1 Tax=Oopsacas minuta TaxID=111878 RepID=A0AAV7JIZ7_9METZ|nr:Gastrula zinc finger protein XlCGF49.1-like [Oopsacas minuta]
MDNWTDHRVNEAKYYQPLLLQNLHTNSRGDFYSVKSEFEIASEYFPRNFKSGAFFDDEIEAVNEGRVEPIEDAWYRPFPTKKRENDLRDCGNKISGEPEQIFDFSKDPDSTFQEDSNENYENNVMYIDLISNSGISEESYDSSDDSDYKPENDRIRSRKTSPKRTFTKRPSKKLKKPYTRLNLEDVLHTLGDNVRPYLDSSTSKKGDIVCPDCPRRFGTYRSLHTHLNIHLKGSFSRCPICQCVYPSKTHLIRHLQHHTNERAFICNICGKGFFYSHCLKQHQQVHVKEKPHVCKFCYAKFARRANFKDHIRTHTGEKPYNCEFCSMKFQRSSMLKSHQKDHCGEMNYKCQICENSFPTNGLLQRHMSNHYNENTIFASQKNGNLREKLNDKSNDSPFECKVCGASFSKSFLRTKHINRHLSSNSISVSYNECV